MKLIQLLNIVFTIALLTGTSLCAEEASGDHGEVVSTPSGDVTVSPFTRQLQQSFWRMIGSATPSQEELAQAEAELDENEAIVQEEEVATEDSKEGGLAKGKATTGLKGGKKITALQRCMARRNLPNGPIYETIYPSLSIMNKFLAKGDLKTANKIAGKVAKRLNWLMEEPGIPEELRVQYRKMINLANLVEKSRNLKEATKAGGEVQAVAKKAIVRFEMPIRKQGKPVKPNQVANADGGAVNVEPKTPEESVSTSDSEVIRRLKATLGTQPVTEGETSGEKEVQE